MLFRDWNYAVESIGMFSLMFDDVIDMLSVLA